MTNKNVSLSFLRVLAVIILFTCGAKSAHAYGVILCSQVLYQNGTENRSARFQKEFERLELRYGDKILLEASEAESSLQYLTLRNADTKQAIGQLSYRFFKDEQKLVIVYVEADKKKIGIARTLFAAALETHPDTKIISTNVLLETNEGLVKEQLAKGLSLEQAIKQTASYKLRASFGFDYIVPESINERYGFVVQKKPDNHGKFMEIQNPVGPTGLKGLSTQLGWLAQEGKVWKELNESTANAQLTVFTRFDRREFSWQKSAHSANQLKDIVATNMKQAPASEDLITLGSHRLRHPARRIANGVWTVDLGKEGRWYFHASTGDGAKNPRAIWLVELIREALDFKQVAEARLGSLNNVKGIFTREISGKNLASYQGHLDTESMYKLMSFDFLAQHRETDFNNFIVTNRGEVLGLPTALEIRADSENVKAPFGDLLPPTYENEFLGRVMGLTPEVAKARWNGKMTTEEIESFLLLREMILLNAKEKGQTANSIPPAAGSTPDLIQVMGF
jgi:hypothetical protein